MVNTFTTSIELDKSSLTFLDSETLELWEGVGAIVTTGGELITDVLLLYNPEAGGILFGVGVRGLVAAVTGEGSLTDSRNIPPTSEKKTVLSVYSFTIIHKHGADIFIKYT